MMYNEDNVQGHLSQNLLRAYFYSSDTEVLCKKMS